MTQQQTTDNPVIPFTDNTSNDNKPTTANNPVKHLPPQGMSRASQLLPFLPFGSSTLWAWSSSGRFPAPVKLSPTMTAWRNTDVIQWLESHAPTTSEV
mgnify:FL=1